MHYRFLCEYLRLQVVSFRFVYPRRVEVGVKSDENHHQRLQRQWVYQLRLPLQNDILDHYLV